MRWVIGDIHGMIGPLQNLIHTIYGHDPHAYLIFVGDYCDRGSNSKEVVDYLLTLDQDMCYFLLGNHDDMLNYFMGNPYHIVLSEFTSRDIVCWWSQFGLLDTLRSYGKNSPYGVAWPDDHVHFYRNLHLYYEDDDCFVVHGYINPQTTLGRFGLCNVLNNQHNINEALWGRFSTPPPRHTKWGKRGIFGHTPQDTPIVTDSIIIVDTGCFKGQPLTAYCVDTGEIVQCV